MRLRRKGTDLLKTAHSSQKELQIAISCRRLIFWHFVPRKRDGYKGETSFGDITPENSCTSNRAFHRVVMVGYVEGFGRRLAEALLAIPREIVESQQGGICDEDHVESSVADDDVVCRFDDFLKRAAVDARRQRRVAVVDKDTLGRANLPIDIFRSVDDFFHIGAVEVRLCEADGAGVYS